MALLLNIDTATEVASVCVSLNGSSLAFQQNEQQREHASFLHVAIKNTVEAAGVHLKDMDAFAVTSGPGSYTGLRVGMATAKGFCYAFSKPFITVNTLEVMANAALPLVENSNADLLCPMIDARRMEVFAALYDIMLNNVWPPQPIVLDETTFDSFMTKGKVVFFGSGSIKFKQLKEGENGLFIEVESNAKSLARLADKAFQQNNFSDVSYSEPNYFKDFYSASEKKIV